MYVFANYRVVNTSTSRITSTRHEWSFSYSNRRTGGRPDACAVAWGRVAEIMGGRALAVAESYALRPADRRARRPPGASPASKNGAMRSAGEEDGGPGKRGRSRWNQRPRRADPMRCMIVTCENSTAGICHLYDYMLGTARIFFWRFDRKRK